MGKYKFGKQEEIVSFEEIQKKVNEAKLTLEQEAYLWLLYWTGVRKSEGYERTVDDIEIKEGILFVDFGQRKKHGAKVPPLEIPLNYYGVDKIVKIYERALRRRPKTKNIFVYVKGKRTRIKKKDRWLFPKVQSTSAWDLSKKVFGKKYYPHFLRLNALTEVGSDKETSITRMKSFSGLKTIKAMQKYLGTSKKEQRAAMAFRGAKAGQIED